MTMIDELAGNTPSDQVTILLSRAQLCQTLIERVDAILQNRPEGQHIMSLRSSEKSIRKQPICMRNRRLRALTASVDILPEFVDLALPRLEADAVIDRGERDTGAEGKHNHTTWKGDADKQSQEGYKPLTWKQKGKWPAGRGPKKRDFATSSASPEASQQDTKKEDDLATSSVVA